MARTPDHDRYGLSGGDYRDLIKLIEQGRPLLEKLTLVPVTVGETHCHEFGRILKTFCPN